MATAGLSQAAAVAHPAIPEIPPSKIYQVWFDGIPVPVNDESHFDFHTAFFSMGKPVTVEVAFSDGASFGSIHPLRHGIKPSVVGNRIRFSLDTPLKLVIKPKGGGNHKPLALCATPLEKNVPAANAGNVIYFGPGVHEPGVIQPVSGQEVYLAPGALVKGRIEVRDATGVNIHGRGKWGQGNGTRVQILTKCS